MPLLFSSTKLNITRVLRWRKRERRRHRSDHWSPPLRALHGQPGLRDGTRAGAATRAV